MQQVFPLGTLWNWGFARIKLNKAVNCLKESSYKFWNLCFSCLRGQSALLFSWRRRDGNIPFSMALVQSEIQIAILKFKLGIPSAFSLIITLVLSSARTHANLVKLVRVTLVLTKKNFSPLWFVYSAMSIWKEFAELSQISFGLIIWNLIWNMQNWDFRIKNISEF